MMDWRECIKDKMVKDVKKDTGLINSVKETAKLKIRSAEILPDELYLVKIILFYDALREYLECLSLERGYKIYNHECYTAFLKEILNLSREADIFDRLRKTRNGINYYGLKVSREEAKEIIKDLRTLINKFGR